MNKFLSLALLIVIRISTAQAQAPEDILHYSFYPQNGTARSIAIGGAMGSLGGDLTATFVNPAGLGMYKTNEFVFTPGLAFNSNKNNFRGTDATSNKTNFLMGNSGFIFGTASNHPQDGWKGHAFSVAVNKTADYNNNSYYKGTNNFTSYSEQYAIEASQSGQDIDGILNNSRYAFGTGLALYSYLIDTFTIGNNVVFKGLPEFLLDNGTALTQEKTVRSSGGMTEIALGYGANYNNRFYIGGTLSFPIVNYQSTTIFRESDPSGNTSNNFDYSELTTNLSTKGVGVGGRLGIIYKPVNQLRLGLAFTTPYIISLTDKYDASMITNTENYNHTISVTSGDLTGGLRGESRYITVTPWRSTLSASYVFSEVADVTKQRGFITADVEYVNYKSASFKSDDQEATQADDDYYKELNDVIKATYRGAFNLKIGGELKFNTIMVRGGYAYYSNPYRDSQLKADKSIISGGLGYRNKGMFVDLTYAYAIQKNVDFPYVLSDKANTFANLKNNRGNLLVTVGFKF